MDVRTSYIGCIVHAALPFTRPSIHFTHAFVCAIVCVVRGNALPLPLSPCKRMKNNRTSCQARSGPKWTSATAPLPPCTQGWTCNTTPSIQLLIIPLIPPVQSWQGPWTPQGSKTCFRAARMFMFVCVYVCMHACMYDCIAVNTRAHACRSFSG